MAATTERRWGSDAARRCPRWYMRGGSGCIPDCWTRWSAGGAEAIEIFAARGHFNYSDRQHVREIANWFRSTGITFNSMHAPMHADDEWGRSGAPPLNIAAVEKRDRIAAMDEIKRAIEVAEQSPFRFLVQHVGVSRGNVDRTEAGIGDDFAGAFACLRQAAGSAGRGGEHSQRSLDARRAWWSCCTRRDSPMSACASTWVTRTWGQGIPQAFETLKTVDSHHACARQRSATRCASVAGRREPSIGRKRWRCCALRRMFLRCCWRSRAWRREIRRRMSFGEEWRRSYRAKLEVRLLGA